MTQTLDSINSALELDPVESHLHPQGSFDVGDHAVPTGREEIWRFTPLKRLRGLHQDAPLDGNGYEVRMDLPAGSTRTIVPAAESDRGLSGIVPADRVSARTWAATTEVLHLDVEPNVELTSPIVVDIVGSGEPTAIARQWVVRIGNHAKATVVFRFTGSATWSDHVELVVGDGAQLSYVTVQDWADDAVHLSAQKARIGRDGSLKHVAVSFGGDVVRHDLTVDYAAAGGSLEALGLYFADAGQHIEHRLFVDHTAPHTKSHVSYKGALQGEHAHTVWIGNVLIRKVAEGIETFEENRNLVLTDGCQADSVPNLEIETGEIEGAGHASATGRFDDEQLFYLRARGIDEKEARRLVVHGFFNELIRKIDVPELEQQLIQTVEGELAKTVTA
ncbi:MAG: Fe-S cluster assembly protein SufD [Marmoricola sp.]